MSADASIQIDVFVQSANGSSLPTRNSMRCHAAKGFRQQVNRPRSPDAEISPGALTGCRTISLRSREERGQGLRPSPLALYEDPALSYARPATTANPGRFTGSALCR